MNEDIKTNKHRRKLGVHLTSIDIFERYIFPEIKEKLYQNIWVDLFAGEGNLVLPILNHIPKEKRNSFFKKQIYLFDVQPEMVKRCKENAECYGIDTTLIDQNISIRNNLKSFPTFLSSKSYPIFHITNPPYLYLGYIRKHKETEIHLPYFEGANEGYQDLYQIAMINDLRNCINNLIYIIPTNFLFGSAVSNKFRMDFLKHYTILKAYLFETKVFKHTGTNIMIGFFKRKRVHIREIVQFKGIKILQNNCFLEKEYKLIPRWKYRAGAEFDEFVEKYSSNNPVKVKYYLLHSEVQRNPGDSPILVIDTNQYISNDYKRQKLLVSPALQKQVKKNILYVRTVDTGSMDGRVGLNVISDDFNVDGIYVSKATYRTSPIQIFFDPPISIEEQKLLMSYFNTLLEYFRRELDSEFLTTYKYSNASYTRKYLGLTQVRNLIRTFPMFKLPNQEKEEFRQAIFSEDLNAVFKLLTKNK